MSGSWLVRFQPVANPAVRLVCFSYAGAGAVVYRPWTALLPSRVELWAVELPGRATRFGEPAIPDVGALADPLALAIRSRMRGPFVLFGHSMGALLAFEVCRRLLRAGALLPAHLVVSAKRAPQLGLNIRPIAGLPDDEFVRAMVERYDGIPPAILRERELLSLMLPMLRADVAAVEGYRYAPDAPLPVPITALAGTRDPIAPVEDVQEWREHTAGRFTLHALDDGHFFVNTSRPAVVELLSRDVLNG